MVVSSSPIMPCQFEARLVSVMLTYLVACVHFLQFTDNPFEGEHPPAVAGTEAQKKFAQVEGHMVIRPKRYLGEVAA